MAELVKVETKKPVVEKITVTLTRSEVDELTYCYEKYYGRSNVTKLLKDAIAGTAKPPVKPPTLTDYLARSVMSNSTF